MSSGIPRSTHQSTEVVFRCPRRKDQGSSGFGTNRDAPRREHLPAATFRNLIAGIATDLQDQSYPDPVKQQLRKRKGRILPAESDRDQSSKRIYPTNVSIHSKL